MRPDGPDNTTPPSASDAGVMRRAGDALRSVLGLHRQFAVDGVRYTERSAEPLRRALSKRGSGRKDYDVTFPDRTTMRIRATPTREYADLGSARLLPVLAMIERHVRPGMRLLDAGAGTGYAAAWLADRAGPSGAVVALERDRESVRYGAARYRGRNIAFECGWLEALAGETDGAFDGVVCCDALRAGDDPSKTVKELWRLVAPGGWVLLSCPACGPGEGADHADGPRAFHAGALAEVVRGAIGADGDPPSESENPAEAGDSGGRLVVFVQRPDRR